jgi:hypothetical protein
MHDFAGQEISRYQRDSVRRLVLTDIHALEQALSFLRGLELQGKFVFYKFDRGPLRFYAEGLSVGERIPAPEAPVVAKHVSRYAHVLARHEFKKVN